MRGGKPPQTTDVILVEGDPISRATIESYLSGQGVRVIAAVDNVHTAMNLIRGVRVGILIAELPSSHQETLEAVRRIRNDFPQLGIIVSSQDSSSQLILRCIRAGAQEFLTRPLDIRELGEAVTRLSTQLGRTEKASAEAGKILVVCSNKGGVGVTSIATNLAVTLARELKKKTVLVDLNAQRGDAELLLDLQPARTLGDVLATNPIDESVLQTALVAHGQNLFLLSGPDWPGYFENVPSVRIVEVFALLKNMFEYVVVDAGRMIASHTVEVLNMADAIMPVALLDVVSIRNVRNHMRLLSELTSSDGKIKLIVNRYQKSGSIDLIDIEKATGAGVFWHIPNEYRTMSGAIDAGNPVVSIAPRSRLAKNLVEFAQQIAGMWPGEQADGKGTAGTTKG